MEGFRFKTYGVDEANEAGRYFTTIANQYFGPKPKRKLETAEWTKLVLGWFTAARRSDVMVNGVVIEGLHLTDFCLEGAPRDGNSTSAFDEVFTRIKTSAGEFMNLDLLHSTWPLDEQGYFGANYWDRAAEARLAGGLKNLMTLESEWKGKTAQSNYAHVMHSATKLSATRADLKVLVFGSGLKTGGIDAADDRDSIGRDVARIRWLTGDEQPWLLVDLPNEHRNRGSAATPAWSVLGVGEQPPAPSWSSSPIATKHETDPSDA